MTAINYGNEDLKDALRRVTHGRGADVIYDPVGGAYAEAALRSIAWRGRFLVVGFAAGEIPKLPLNLVLLKGCDVLGVFWGSWIERDPARSSRQYRTVTGVVQGRKIVVARACGLSVGGSADCAQGHRGKAGDGQGDLAAVRLYANSASLAFATARCSGRIWLATSLIVVARTAASSVKPSTGSTSGIASSGNTK